MAARLSRRLILSLCAGLLFADLLLTWKALNPYDASLERVLAAGVLRVGIDPTYPPYGVFAGETISGLDADLAEEIAARLGVRVQFVPLGIDGLYDALAADQIDLLLSAVAFDPYRLNEFLYLRSYMDAGQVLVSANATITTMGAMEGRTLAVEYGSLGDELARRWVRRLRVLNLTHHLTTDAALDALRRGEAAPPLVDHTSARLYLRTHPDAGLFIAPQSVQSDPYCPVTRLRALKLAMAVNAALEAMADDGTLEKLLQRWL